MTTTADAPALGIEIELPSEGILRISKDMKKTLIKNVTRRNASYMVDYFYQIQEMRKRVSNQIDACKRASEPHDLLDWGF